MAYYNQECLKYHIIPGIAHAPGSGIIPDGAPTTPAQQEIVQFIESGRAVLYTTEYARCYIGYSFTGIMGVAIAIGYFFFSYKPNLSDLISIIGGIACIGLTTWSIIKIVVGMKLSFKVRMILGMHIPTEREMGFIEDNQPMNIEAKNTKEWLALNPKDERAWHHLGKILVEEEDYAGAINAFEQVVWLNPNSADGWNDLGFTLYILEDYSGATKAFEHALAIDPKNAKAWFNLGVAQHDAGCIPDAIPAYMHALELDPNNAELLYNLARAESLLGHLVECIKFLKKTFELDTNFKSLGKNETDFAFVRDSIEFKTLFTPMD